MIRKVKLKFILISSFSMLLVLIIVLGVINGVSYFNSRVEIFSLMNRISENGGILPDHLEYHSIIGDVVLTEESRYTLRFFSAVVDSDGNVLEMDRGHIASISDVDAREYVSLASQRSSEEGFLYGKKDATFAYQKTELGNNTFLCVILDCTRQLHSMRQFMLVSVYIGLASMLLLLLILSFFSKKAVAPIARNIEKQKMFITNAGHELKTPLAIISANTEVLEMMEGKNEWTESTMEQVQRMSELVSHLITLSKLQEKDEVVLSNVNFSEVVEKVAAEFRVLAEKNQLQYTTEIARDKYVKADEAGLRELVSILVDNALKYCSEGGQVLINLDSSKLHGAVLSVSNTYPEQEGVDYSKFFDRFYRADESHNSEKKGFGIGLSMAQHFTEMFKGKIGVHYKNGMITFTVAFNAKKG